MQQTQTYKLNKPGNDDPIAIAPLNENMEKIEAALTAEAQARAEADAVEIQARQSAIAAEAQARADADATETQARQAAVNSEAQTRANADAAETQARQAAVNSEAQTRAAADASETQARQSADTSEAQTRAAADAALNNRAGAIEGRVAVLEAHKVRMAVGTYAGTGKADGDAQVIPVGFTPRFVMVVNRQVFNGKYIATTGSPEVSYTVKVLEIVDGGFRVVRESHACTNTSVHTHTYVALG